MGITICGQRTLISLPMKEEPDKFTKLTSTKKSNTLQKYLNQQRESVTQIVTALMEAGKPVTPQSIKEFIQTGGIKVYTLKDLIDDYLQIRENQPDTTYESYMRYKRVYDVLLDIVGDKQLSDVSYNDMLKVHSNLFSTCTPATATGKFNKIRQLLVYAVNDGKLSSNPTYGIKCHKGKAKIEFLNEEEVRKIESKVLDNERLEKVRKCALLMCSTGLSYIDLVHFDKSKVSSLSNVYIYSNFRHKTEIQFNSVILPAGLKILEEIGWDVSSIIMTNQVLNRYLKELGAICGIDTELHCHLFRKTYATMLLNSGVDLQTVKRCVGHESNSSITTKIYAFLQEKTVAHNVSKAMGLVADSNLPA